MGTTSPIWYSVPPLGTISGIWQHRQRSILTPPQESVLLLSAQSSVNDGGGGGRSKECGVGPDRGPRLRADASNRVGRTCSHTLSTIPVTHQHQHHQIPENSKTQTWILCELKQNVSSSYLVYFVQSMQVFYPHPTTQPPITQDRPQPIDFSEGGPSASLPVLSNLLTQESHTTVFHTLSPKSLTLSPMSPVSHIVFH